MFKTASRLSKDTFKVTQNNFNQFKHMRQEAFKKRQMNTYPNLSQGSNTGSLVTGAAGTLLLLGGGYYALKHLNGPRQVTTFTQAGEQVTYTDNSTMIANGVQNYLAKTFSYVGAGAALTAGAAITAFKTGLVNKVAVMGPMGSIGLFGATFGAMYLTQAIDPKNTILKHTAFAGFNGIMGVSLCTLGLFAPSTLLIRAGLMSLGIVSGLSFVALVSKEERFLMWGGALSSGLMVLIISSFARAFMPARFMRLNSALDNLWLYGGLALFGGLMLYDTQRVLRNAKQFEEIKYMASQSNRQLAAQIPQPDYIRESISIYMNLINIFIRLVILQGNRK